MTHCFLKTPVNLWRATLGFGGLLLANLALASQAPGNDLDPLAPPVRAVTQSVLGWAYAWQQRDISAYAASYKSGYRGKYSSHAKWLKARKRSLRGKSWIRLDVNQLNIRFVNPEHAIAEFVQRYESSQFTSKIRKRLDLSWHNDAWRICREQVIGRKTP